MKSASRSMSSRMASLRTPAPVALMAAPAKKRAATKAASKTAAKRVATKSARQRTTVTQMPQSLEKAARQAAMFLYTNDTWSLRYFDPNDLHSLERKLFG